MQRSLGMAKKSEQLHKLIKIRTTLVKFKLPVKSVNPILEDLLKREKPPLDAKLLRDIESMLQDRGYLKSSRLRTTEIDREICQLLEDLLKAFTSDTPAPPPEPHKKEHPKKVVRQEPNLKKRAAATLSSDTRAPPPELHKKEHPNKAVGQEPNLKKRSAATPSSDTRAPPPELHTNEHANKGTGPEPNPKKRAAATPPSSEPQVKKSKPTTGPHAAKNPMGPGRPSTQPVKATVPPWPLKSVTLGPNLFMIGNENCSPVIDVDPKDQSFRMYDQKKGFLNQGAAFRFQATTSTTILFSRPDKQIFMRNAGGEVKLQLGLVKYLDQVVSALKRNRSDFKMEHSPCSNWPRLQHDDSEQDSFSQVKKEGVQCKVEGSERPEVKHAKM